MQHFLAGRLRPGACIAALSVAAIAALAPATRSQITNPQGTPEQSIDRRHGVPGKRAGTESWVVHFKTRSFDLSKFRAAIYARRPHTEVEAIVNGYERQVEKDIEPFRETVEDKFAAEITHAWWLVNACAIEVDPKHLPAILKLANVARIEPNVGYQVALKSATNAKNHNSDVLHKAGITGKGVTVGIMDTGQDEAMGSSGRPHRMYFPLGDAKNKTGSGIGKSRLVLNKAFGVSAAGDTNGHGTGVASIVAGGNWGTSGADHGHAYEANIAGYAIPSTWGGLVTAMASAWQAMAKDRAKHNIVAANLSYHGSPSLTAVDQMALDAAALNADIMICCAAGNRGASTAQSQSCANGLAVAAVTRDAHVVATFSSKGPITGGGGRTYPDISGNGVSTVMARRDNESTDWVASGTSMASPQVCGAAALVRSVNTKVTTLETKAILLASAQSIADANKNLDRNAYGMGLVRCDLAVGLVQTKNAYGLRTVSKTSPKVVFPISVVKGKQYAVCATWFRTVMSSTNYSNLDLRIMDGPVAVAESKTPKNLYEMVQFLATRTGSLLVEVTGTSFDANSVQFGWAVTETQVPIAGRTVAFGKGCLGTGFPDGSPCVRVNQGRTMSTSIDHQAGSQYWVEFQPKVDIDFEGFSIRSRARGGATQSVPTSIWDAKANGEPNKALAKSSVVLGNTLQNYRSLFTQQVSLKKGQTYFLEMTVPKDGLNLPIAQRSANGTDTPFWAQLFTGGFRQIPSTQWSYEIICRITKRGAVPVLSARDRPVLGNQVTLDLRLGLGSAPMLIITGFNARTWGGLTLPWQLPGSNCSLHTSLDIANAFTLSSVGGMSGNYNIPNQRSLLGEVWFHQGAIVDTKANGFGWVTTNALRMEVGDR